MSDTTPDPGAESSGPATARVPARLAALLVIRIIFGVTVIAAILFLAAGTTDWPGAWAYLALVASSLTGFAVLVAGKDRALLEERMRADRNTDIKRWDRLLVIVIGMVLPPATWLVAGLDRRYGWSPGPGFVLGAVALLIALLGSALVIWAAASNTFFSAIVRIQKDRGHTVVTGGPYAAVRHPGYVGTIAVNLAAPVVLGSVWALAICAVIVVLVVIRTALEDRTLQRELDGYADYARRVRWRLLPGVW